MYSVPSEDNYGIAHISFRLTNDGWYVLPVCLSVCIVGRGGALVETITFNRRVVGSTPGLAAT